mmetsp:Transcript_29156/g.5272  ORF Transcript_29156/g.5272 Transcript_29156/m.5272 type:complete len:97 (-) Transcript_29156:29-319(-)
MTHIVTPTQAKINLARYIQKMAYLRDRTTIDYMLNLGNQWLGDAAWSYSYWHNWSNIVAGNFIDESSGYSYLEEKMYEGCSTFLKDFYTSKDKVLF